MCKNDKLNAKSFADFTFEQELAKIMYSGLGRECVEEP